MEEITPTPTKYDQYIAPLYRARNQAILKMRQDGISLADIGRLFHISRERVRQVVQSELKAAGYDAAKDGQG